MPANIQTISAAITGQEVTELPCINFVRKRRVVVQNLNSTLAAIRLGEADEWHQLFTDGTYQRKIVLQNLVIAFMVDSKLNPVIVYSCMFLEDDKSDNQVKSIRKTGNIECEYVMSKHLPLIITNCSLPYSAIHIEAVLKKTERSHRP